MLLKTFEIVDGANNLNPNHLIVILDSDEDYYQNIEFFEKNPKVKCTIKSPTEIKLTSDGDEDICEVTLPWENNLQRVIETWLDYCEEKERLKYV